MERAARDSALLGLGEVAVGLAGVAGNVLDNATSPLLIVNRTT